MKRTGFWRDAQGRECLIDVARQRPQCALSRHSDPYDAGTPEVWERADLCRLNRHEGMPFGYGLEGTAQSTDETLILLAEKLERHV